MKVRNFAHNGLKRLYIEDSAKGVPPETADKLRKMLVYLDNIEDPEELRALTAWRVHTLTGDRKGTWSLSVTRNHRLTFRIDTAEREIYDVNLESNCPCPSRIRPIPAISFALKSLNPPVCP